jgi:hypothetical protein
MNNEQIPHANFGARPKFSPFGKIRGYLTAMVAGGAIASAAAYLGTVALPDGYGPGDVAGKMAAAAVRWETNESVDATTNKVRRESDAAAQSQAKAQVDVAMASAAISERTQALAPLDSIGTMSDVVCIGSKRVAQAVGREWQDVLGVVAQVTCGVGDVVRPMVLQSQIEAGTTAAAARGMPLRDASVAVHPNPAPATLPPAGRATVTPVQAVTPVKTRPTPMDLMQAMTLRQASQHYTREQVKLAETIAEMLPPEIRSHMRDGLAPGDDDVFVERVGALVKLAERMQ